MRSLIRRRGVTLPELMLTLVLATMFAAALLAVVRVAGSQTAVAVARAAAHRDQVAVWALASHDLRHAARADVHLPSGTALEFARPIGEGPICAVEPQAVLVRSDHGGFVRSPDPGRDQLLLRESTAAGLWFSRGIVSVAVANCPDGRAAFRLATDAPIAAAGFARIAEPVRLRSYPSGGTHAVGLEGRSGAATIQPLAGPIDPEGFGVTLAGHVLGLRVSRPPLAMLDLALPLLPPP